MSILSLHRKVYGENAKSNMLVVDIPYMHRTTLDPLGI